PAPPGAPPAPATGSSDLPAHLAHALREAPDPFVDLGRREGAEGEAKEALAATVREEREAIGEMQVPRRGRRAHGTGARAGGESERDEEAAVGTGRLRVGDGGLERREAGVEPRGVERLQALE